MYAIRQLANIFAATVAPTPTPTPTPRRTRATIQLSMPQSNTDPQAPPRVPPTVPRCRPPRPIPSQPPRVEPPPLSRPHRYPLRSCTQANHKVENIGGGTVAFQEVLDPATGNNLGYMQLIRGPDKGTWTMAFSNDIGRMAKGVGKRIKGTNTILFIHRSGVSAGKRVAYKRIVVSIRPNKTETHQVRIIVEG